MSTEANAVCAVCGSKYQICLSCKSTNRLTPWRSIADTADCYKIYMIIHDYTGHKISKEKARELSGTLTVPPRLQAHVKAVVNEIMESDQKNRERRPADPTTGETS